MFDDYGDHGFEPLTINLGEDMETVVKFHARRYTHTYLRDNGSVWPVYRQNGYIPLNYVVDTSGVIRYVAEGFNEAVIRQIIETWLPSTIENDVGVKKIVVPSGNVDSAETIVPSCTTYNYGKHTETYPVRMRIGDEYDTTVTVTAHAPNTARYIEFPEWVPTVRGLAAVTCTTELDGDDIKSNNVQRGTATVMVYDLAVNAILAPSDTVDSAAVVIPQAEVANYGTFGDLAKVKLFIGDSYIDSVSVPIQPNRTTTVSFKEWIAVQTGEFAVRCTVIPRSKDLNPANDLKTMTVFVKGASGVAEPGLSRPVSTFCEVAPNPAAGPVLIRYYLPGAGSANLSVYSVSGALVRVLCSGRLSEGHHAVIWDGRDVTGRKAGRGVYYVRLETAGALTTGKLVTTD